MLDDEVASELRSLLLFHPGQRPAALQRAVDRFEAAKAQLIADAAKFSISIPKPVPTTGTAEAPAGPPDLTDSEQAKVEHLARRVVKRFYRNRQLTRHEISDDILHSSERRLLPYIVEYAEAHGWATETEHNVWKASENLPVPEAAKSVTRAG